MCVQGIYSGGDYCDSLVVDADLFKAKGAQPFNYTDALDALPPSFFAFGAATALAKVIEDDTDSAAAGRQGFQFQLSNAGGDATGSTVSDAGTFVLAETALDMHCWGENPVVVAKLQLNGQDRFSEREGSYFDVVQPSQHHSKRPDSGINVYSFALRPEEHQPSGSCNFSRIDNATLQLVLSNATVAGTATAKVRVYATNYNVLRIMSGMGGLAYSN